MGDLRVAIGCDPNSVGLKKAIEELLVAEKVEFEDFGSDDPIYANVAFEVAEAVARGDFDRGILIGGTGLGVCIAANKVPGVFATLLTDAYSAERAVKSHNSNVAAFGSLTIGPMHAVTLAKIWLEARWEEGSRSEPKVRRITDYVEKLMKRGEKDAVAQ